MARIGIVGSGQAGLLLAHGLVQDGHSVELWSDRSPEDWLDRARPTGTAVRFATSLAYERRLGLTQGHAEAPTMDGLRVTICSHPARPLLTLSGRFATSPLAIDVRLQSARWMEALTAAGGQVVVRRASPEDIDTLAARCDLTVIATGKEGGELFARDAARSPADRPLRHLAMVNCEGPAARFADIPFSSAKFTILEGLGECYWTPWWHKDGKAVWNLVFEAKAGTALDRFSDARSGEDVLERCAGVIREMMPWDADWIAGARLADPNSWLVGAITPTVRDPNGRTLSGHRVIPLGDAWMAFDPLGAQGANMGNRLAMTLVDAIRAGGPFDDAWVRATYDAFWERWGGPSMRWTQLLLAPMGPAARYLFLAQLGADGRALGATGKQRLADAFAGNFDDPRVLGDTLADFGESRRFVHSVLGAAGDWEAIKGLATVAGRLLRNASG